MQKITKHVISATHDVQFRKFSVVFQYQNRILKPYTSCVKRVGFFVFTRSTARQISNDCRSIDVQDRRKIKDLRKNPNLRVCLSCVIMCCQADIVVSGNYFFVLFSFFSASFGVLSLKKKLVLIFTGNQI